MKKRKSELSVPKRAAIGAAVIVGLYLISTLIMTVFLFNNEDGTKITGIFSLAALMISGGLGTFISARLLDLKSLPRAFSPACAVLVLYTAVSLVITGGKIGINHAMNMICFLLIAFLFAFLSAPRAKKRHIPRR